jgi:hypothetical protein
MDESFSRTGFVCGMAFVLAVRKACTLLIWRTLPKPRPPLRQELLSAPGEAPNETTNLSA